VRFGEARPAQNIPDLNLIDVTEKNLVDCTCCRESMR